jgi:hypothetical protein
MRFLSADFLSSWAHVDYPKIEDAAGIICIKIDGGPDGKLVVSIVMIDGRVVSAELGSVRGRNLELKMTYELAASLYRGEVDPAVEYMKGEIKVDGEMALWLKLLPVLRERFVSQHFMLVPGEIIF